MNIKRYWNPKTNWRTEILETQNRRINNLNKSLKTKK